MSPKHHITLKTNEPIDKSNLQFWHRAVKIAAPNILLSEIIIKDNAPKSVRIIHTTKDKKHYYCIPLSRNLANNELAYIKNFSNDLMPVDEFEIEHTSSPEPEIVVDIPVLGEEAYESLCQKLSKSMHQYWYQNKVAEGWRYGQEFSVELQTHPMLLPWDSLPKEYQKINYELPKIVMDAFRDEGFVLVSEKKLNKLANKFNRIK